VTKLMIEKFGYWFGQRSDHIFDHWFGH